MSDNKLLEEQLEKLEKLDLVNAPIEKIWEVLPVLSHIPSKELRDKLEVRQRQKKVRYMLFRLKNQADKKEPLEQVDGLLPGFIEFWLGEKPVYAKDPRGNKIPVPPNKNKHIFEIGGYKTFATTWDVDSDLLVYLRHSSVWQEWNVTLAKIVPVLGQE